MIEQITNLKKEGVPITQSCSGLAIARSSFYGWQASKPAKPSPQPRPTPKRALSIVEKNTIRDVLNSDRFANQPPRQVFASLLDEGQYLCSVRSMYRILAANGEVKERRNQRKHPKRIKPELQATRPNQVWTWDITKFRTFIKYQYAYLYVILDMYSRFVVGWMVAQEESSELAQQLIGRSCQSQKVQKKQLTLHSDRGAPMVALTTAQLLEKLGVQKSHSRPYTPNDNPYSESQFKTMKYRPDFPGKFETHDEARKWSQSFFHWYNNQHYHMGLNLLTPATVHFGRVDDAVTQRNCVLLAAYEKNPERFVGGLPQQTPPPSEVWINAPTKNIVATGFLQ